MIERVEHADDPRLGVYSNLTDARLRQLDFAGSRGVFMAEGELVVRQLVASRYAVRSLLVTPGGLERVEDVVAGLPAEVPVFVAEQGMLEGVVGFSFHRGILACGERGEERGVEEVVGGSRVLVVLEGLSNTDNVGSVFRNVGSLVGRGAGVLLSPGCCDPLYRKALRVSIGQALRVPFATVGDWPRGMGVVKEAGFEVLALTPGGVDIGEVKVGRKLAFLLGAEGPGLTEGAMGMADVRVAIPMAAGADSLNVATAGAVAMSRLCRPDQ